jgi:hypothetical protein
VVTIIQNIEDGSKAPSPAEQDEILDRTHRYAEQYVSSLPNFICVQTTRQLEAGRKSDRWHKGDTLTSKLTFTEGHEHRALELVNGKDARLTFRHWRTPLVTEGEFGLLLSRVLGPDSEASFTWNGWQTIKERRLAVFDYSVDKEHSSLSLHLSDLAKAVLPYHGSVYADPETGAVWRITDTATEIPAVLETEEISTTIDYGQVQIGEKTYLLPTAAAVSLLLAKKKVRNEMDFQDYRKFEAKSAITFGSPDSSDRGKESK